MVMRLPKIEEPIEIKEFIRNTRRSMGPESNIDWDSLAVWTFNKLPKFLWDAWKDQLKQHGIKWQTFLKILRLHTDDFIKWAIYDKISWGEVLKRLTSTIEQYSQGDIE
ncbi:hypothetical protein [Thermococcus sp. LS2]|uniref:hypothetical protein n=1 Tax=Thermococcus sp. LS2 TaxID=1638260 RepID=UPI00143C900B|nr:hypothetical protein [Thermococcus sp. LS2]NJE13850.1 hypothetical protein [Thermococcus sp. LS2]